MKLRNSIWTLFLVLTLLITCTTVKTFAEGEKGGSTDGPKPISLSYSGQTLTYHDGAEDVNGFYEEGNRITVYYNDGSKETYIYKTFYDDYYYDYQGYYLNGEVQLDEYGDPDYYDYEYFEVVIPQGGIPSGTTKLSICYSTYYDDEELCVYGEVDVERKAEITSTVFSGAPLHYYESDFYGDEVEIDILVPGNTITLNYDNGTSEVYICTAYYDEENEDTYYYYVLNGEIALDEYGDLVFENMIWPYCTYTKGDAKAKIYDWNNKIYAEVSASIAPRPVSAAYDGCTLHYSLRECSVEGLYTENNKITITYDDGSTADYICKPGEDWDGETRYNYYLNGDTDTNYLNIYVDEENFEVGTEEVSFTLDMIYGEEPVVIHGKLPVTPKSAPQSIEFIPGDEAFVVEGLIGKRYVDERNFEGEGNKFVITYEDGSTIEYIWLPDTEDNSGGFKLNGNYYKTNFSIRADLKDGVKKGTHDVTFVYRQNVDINGEVEEVSVPMTVPVTATKQFTYLKFSNVDCPYTGKAVKPAAKLYRYDGKLLATKIYTVKYPNAVKVGYYNATPKIKSTYSGVYGTDYDSIGWFRIVPKKEAISKLTAGKKSFTVSWSKFSGQQATGYQVQYALNSKFTKSKKTVTVTSYKTNKKTIKNLKGKKKYYVRVRAYKTVDGKKLYGAWSKAKYVTTKS